MRDGGMEVVDGQNSGTGSEFPAWHISLAFAGLAWREIGAGPQFSEVWR